MVKPNLIFHLLVGGNGEDIYISGQTVDLSKMSRQEVVALKTQLESERKVIEGDLLRPADLGPSKIRKAKEAFEIKGQQIHRINEYLRQRRKERCSPDDR